MAATERLPRSTATPGLLSIGELSERSGVPTSALRYYDELGLVRPASRAAGRRRYTSSAIAEVNVVLFLREIGFSLAEISRLITAESQSWKAIVQRKLDELTQQQQRLETARIALEHGLRCPAGEPMKCPRFWSIIEDHSSGLTLEDSHARAHAQPRAHAPQDRPAAPPSE
ncbi:MAG TPA: MerR family transcriptional regulator [Jatrophihabitantaceae bacterium]|jgi:DNA-binding transcriptional MerR regulator